ncbi:MAG: histidine kinase [Cyclobacteriaceae bacterium]
MRSKSDHAEDAVVKLSHLLRYILYQANAAQVDLEKEINHLHDFIELQKMRIAKTDSLQVSVNGDLKNKMIVPLLLLPLAENFFKHGDFSTDFINKLSISINEGVLTFLTENWIAINADESHGIGLNNVKKRLELHYPQKHELKYSIKDSVFYLELKLVLI